MHLNRAHIIIVIFISLVVAAALAIFLFHNAAPVEDDLIVTLPDGKIRGAVYSTSNNFTYYGFRGIPYAIPPVGSLRLESPQKVKPWDGIRDATTDGKSCISLEHFRAPEDESEDCLYVNVYVPKIKANQTLPVMFWIYGGAFKSGNSRKNMYGPDFLIEKDVIVVSFNYRVGPLGFMSTGDKSLPGNYGMKDQNLALRWTFDNIEYFGGDPHKITIFGQSAGGTSTGLHLISKRSAGLFRAAIAESGSALVYWAVDPDPKSKAYAIADTIPGGNYGNDTQKLKEFLKSRTVEEIVTAVLPLVVDDLPMPTLEEESDDAFLTKPNFDLIESGDFNRVPILIGMCAQESLMFLRDLETTKQYAISYDTDINSIIPHDLFHNPSDAGDINKKIRGIYLKDGENFSDNLIATAEVFSGTTFTRGLLKQAQLSSNYVPVFLYEFAYFGRSIAEPFVIDGSEKATHFAEVPFLFKLGSSFPNDPQDSLTQNRMVALWTNFAKYLNPTPEKSELFENITWPIMDQNNMQYLNINATLEIRQHLGGDIYLKWNEVYETYGRKPFITF